MLIFETTHVAVEGSFSSVILPTMYRDGGGVHNDLGCHPGLTSTRTTQEHASGQLCLVGTGSRTLFRKTSLNRRCTTAFSVINFLMMFFAPVSLDHPGRENGIFTKEATLNSGSFRTRCRCQFLPPPAPRTSVGSFPGAYLFARQATARGAQRTLHPRPAEPAESSGARIPN